MMIPPFSLPSRPDKKVQLTEITVQDAIDFAGVEPSKEEELTTEFLKRASGEDSRDWTADDRRFALYWYWLHTATDLDMPITYECSHCGQSHTYLLDGRSLVDEYQTLNRPAHEVIEHRGKSVVVRPITGEKAEGLEIGRVILDTLKENSPDYRKQEACNRLNYIIAAVEFTSEEQGAEEIIMSMGATAFSELAAQVEEILYGMAHGLNTVYENGKFYLVTPPSQCQVVKEATTRIRVPFRCNDYIPGL